MSDPESTPRWVRNEPSVLAISISPLRGNGRADFSENISASLIGKSVWLGNLIKNGDFSAREPDGTSARAMTVTEGRAASTVRGA